MDAKLSINDQFRLIDEERKLIYALPKYIEAENARLRELQNFKIVLIQSTKSYASDEEFAWNPLAIYRTVKHLTVDFDRFEAIMTRNNYDDILPKISIEYSVDLPNTAQLYDRIRELITLQKLHNLTVADIMDGRLLPVVTQEPALTAEDCFYIGRTCAEKFDHETAVEWFQGCEGRFTDLVQDQVSRMLVQISSALFTSDKSVIRRVNKMLYKDPKKGPFSEFAYWDSEKQNDHWECFRTCAGDYKTNMALPNLRCRYNHHNSPFLTIAPLKEEMLSLAPKISIFREALYEADIELLKNDAFELFRPARVRHYEGVKADPFQRPSETAFLNTGNPKYSVLWNRLQDITSLSLKFCEYLQMLYYAPGGFYRVHNDFMTSCWKDRRCSALGNRVATTLMYLNDVTLGGNTVFPRLRLSVQPVKGSVLYWISMKADNSMEVLTRHASCPLVYGEKIACTQWFRMRGQDHWIAEPEDDLQAKYPMNPNIMCMRQKSP